jgi:hypothetical protein
MKDLTDRKEIKRRREKLKIKIVSKIKNRSKKKNVLNEISKDIEKIKLEPENLILIDYIDKKISNP